MTASPDVHLNADFAQRVCIDTQAMAWQSSPSATVWRKRLHLDGPPEAGRVTSVVRYDPNSSFPAHGHPQGEEILVLSGVFSDNQGNWGPGSYLLNPEGFSHAPFSEGGCIIFVKLKQYPGTQQLAIDSARLKWQPSEAPGIRAKSLFVSAELPEVMDLEQFAGGIGGITRAYPRGAEIFVLEGDLTESGRSLGPGTWLRLPPGAAHTLGSHAGGTIFIKQNHLA